MPLQLVLLLLVLVLVSGEDWEHELVQYPSPARLRAHLEHLTRFPHPAGSPGARKAAQYVAKQFDRAGLPTHIIQFNALISNPVSAKLTLLQDNIRAKLAEEIVQQDHTSDTWYRNHSYHAYSPSALVKAPLVYVNYGLEQDFGELEKRGIPLQGKIAIVKYGRSFRGLKVLNAQKRGMLGMLIYSDPKDDGYVRGATYPDGSWRPKSGIQRGNVQFASRCSGDPGFIERDPDICGYASEDLMPKIPSMPISYEDAKPLLASLGGDNSPPEWHGGLDVPYNIGPGPGVVEMEVNNTREVAKLWNVVVKIPGKDFPDEEIILGNHRDAWVYGAVDPNSGTCTMF
jgi:N-acetylated-alpha-linked acidic dipeptidase